VRYNIKEKFWGWGDNFHVLDEAGRSAFFVNGKAFSWGSKLSFQNMEGRELAFISQKLLTFRPKYEIYRDGALFAEIVKEFSWFKKEFTLDVPGPNDYTINGSFWDYRYEFLRGGRVVAQVSRAFWSWTHCYGVEIADGEDDVSVLCAAIVIDQVLHDENQS
jgi:uncharacterized protein YxjI